MVFAFCVWVARALLPVSTSVHQPQTTSGRPSFGTAFRGLALGLLLSATVTNVSAETDAQFDIVLQHADDTVQVQQDHAQVCFVIRSHTGIGKVTIDRKASRWPQKVLVRLHTQGLESLKLKAGETRLQLAVSSHNKEVRQWLDADDQHLLDAVHPQWISVRILNQEASASSSLPLPAGCFELVLPASILAANPPNIAMEWIDFYRR